MAMASVATRRRVAVVLAVSAAVAVAAMVVAVAAPTEAATSQRLPPQGFIIVCGGTAGCTLAARLCAGLPRGANIVLLGRGAPRNAKEEFLVRAPRNAGIAWGVPSLTAAFSSAPNPGLGGRRAELLTFATLGGLSTINDGQWSEPNDGSGAGSWGVASLNASTAAAYYARAATALGVAVPPPGLRHKYVDDWLNAAAAAGLPRVDGSPEGDPPPPRGSWIHPLAVSPAGRRVDACTAYVTPALAGACAANLRVPQGVTVTKLLFAPSPPGGSPPTVVTGVEYVPSDEAGAAAAATIATSPTLSTRCGVLLAAGPYGSVPLLHRSGIGPAAAPRDAGIPPLVDLPFGEGVQARAMRLVVGAYLGVPLAPVNNPIALALPSTLAQWVSGRGGLLATSTTTGLSRWTGGGGGGYTVATFSTDAATAGLPLFVAACLPNSESYGRLRVAAANVPAAFPPVVETNLLGKAEEVSSLLVCMRQQQAVLDAFRPGFCMVTVQPPRNETPPTEAYVRANFRSAFHLVGGCTVGTVLDDQLRVKCLTNLWVVDASVAATIPRAAGPLSSVYALAEYDAEVLVRQYQDVCWVGGGR